MTKKLFAALLVFALFYLLPALTFAQITQNSPSKPHVFTHATVIDATGAPAKPDMTVVISDGRIVALGRTGKIRIPKDAQTIDATGKFLIPGLWDMHVHLSFYADTKEPPFTAFPLLIANGVTGVRDMGGNLEQIDKWRKEIADGRLMGPRIFRAGPYVDGPKKMNEFRASMTIVVKDAEEARAAVRNLKKRGVDFIKVHNAVPHDAYLALADECRKQKIPLATHLPRSVRIAEASDAGTHSIEHIEMLIESISFDVAAGEKPKDPLAALAEITDEKANALFARFVKNRTWYTPTLVGYRSFVQEAEEGAVKDAAKWNETLAARTKIFNRFKQLVGIMQKSGVGILAGTDFARKRDSYPYPVPQPGTDLHDELVLFVESGLTPLEALQTATLNPAKYLNIQKDYGTVEKGKIADLVLLDANPLENIKNTRRVAAVVIGGRLILKSELQMMLDKLEADVQHTPCTQGRVLSAQERIAQRDIQERINESIEADMARDAEAGAHNLTDDFTVRLLDGTVLNRQQMLEGNKEQKDDLLLVSDNTRITIDCLALKGREATVYTNQHYVRYMPDRKDGSPHEVITNITHKESWVFTSEGWKVKYIEELQEGSALLNGQPYNP